jgi:hypothetical protein
VFTVDRKYCSATTRLRKPNDHYLNKICCEYLKSYTKTCIWKEKAVRIILGTKVKEVCGDVEVWLLKSNLVFCNRPDNGSLSWNRKPDYVFQVYMLVVTVLLIRVNYNFELLLAWILTCTVQWRRLLIELLFYFYCLAVSALTCLFSLSFLYIFLYICIFMIHLSPSSYELQIKTQ